MSIVKKGDKIGKVHIKIYPTDSKAVINGNINVGVNNKINISEETMNGIIIYNPRDYI